jgi:predicted dehydrogenase
LRFLQQRGWPVKVTGLCDVRKERLILFQSMFPKAQAFSSPETLLAAGNIDALILLTPPAVTPELIKAGVQLGIPVFTEKPVSHDANELGELYALSEQSRVPVQVGYNRRYQPLADAFLQKVKLSGLRSIEARLWRINRSEPHFYTDTMVHALDFLEYAFGPLQVEQAIWAPAVDGEPLRRSVRVTLINKTGLRCGLDVRPATNCCVESYEAADIALNYTVQGQPMGESEETLLCLRGFIHQLAAFLRLAAGENETSRCTLDDARRTCELCERIMARMHQ